MLEHLLVLCQRANRMQNFIDSRLDLAGLERADDPVMLVPERAAAELLSFGSEATGDQMPGLEILTHIAFHFDCNGADLYPSLGPISLHLSAACALGRQSRIAAAPVSDLEHWGLRGLAEERFDKACFPELRAARQWLREVAGPQKGSGSVALPLPPRDGLYNVPIVLKPERR